MLIATWNVNSIRARKDRVLAWLDAHRPDVLCVQEIKVETAGMADIGFEGLGYRWVANGERTYNGVAILARDEIQNVSLGMIDAEPGDSHARLIAGTVENIRILSVYVPNGQLVGSEKYIYKLRWMERLRAYLERNCDPNGLVAVCGDFNVAPDERDCHDPAEWENQTLFHIDSRKALSNVVEWGLVDAFRIHHREGGVYSWWDYRQLGFPKNRGLRIDHVLVTKPLAARVRASSIDREERKGKLPSDHAPMLVEVEPVTP